MGVPVPFEALGRPLELARGAQAQLTVLRVSEAVVDIRRRPPQPSADGYGGTVAIEK